MYVCIDVKRNSFLSGKGITIGRHTVLINYYCIKMRYIYISIHRTLLFSANANIKNHDLLRSISMENHYAIHLSLCKPFAVDNKETGWTVSPFMYKENEIFRRFPRLRLQYIFSRSKEYPNS